MLLVSLFHHWFGKVTGFIPVAFLLTCKKYLQVE